MNDASLKTEIYQFLNIDEENNLSDKRLLERLQENVSAKKAPLNGNFVLEKFRNLMNEPYLAQSSKAGTKTNDTEKKTNNKANKKDLDILEKKIKASQLIADLSRKMIDDNLKVIESKERLIKFKKEEIQRTKAEKLHEKKEKFFEENAYTFPGWAKIVLGIFGWLLSIYAIEKLLPEFAENLPTVIPVFLVIFIIFGTPYYAVKKIRSSVRKSHANIVTSPSFSNTFSVSGNSFTDADSFEYVSKSLKTRSVSDLINAEIFGIFTPAHLSQMNDLFIHYLLSEQVIRKKQKLGNMRTFTLLESDENE